MRIYNTYVQYIFGGKKCRWFTASSNENSKVKWLVRKCGHPKSNILLIFLMYNFVAFSGCQVEASPTFYSLRRAGYISQMVVVNGQNLFFDAHIFFLYFKFFSLFFFFLFLQRNSRHTAAVLRCGMGEKLAGVGVLDGATTDIK